MHKVNIPKWAVDRVIERRGSAHPYAKLDPARTALIVVDLQNGFMVDGVAHALRRSGARAGRACFLAPCEDRAERQSAGVCRTAFRR